MYLAVYSSSPCCFLSYMTTCGTVSENDRGLEKGVPNTPLYAPGKGTRVSTTTIASDASANGSHLEHLEDEFKALLDAVFP
jgi:hypothetical protein